MSEETTTPQAEPETKPEAAPPAPEAPPAPPATKPVEPKKAPLPVAALGTGELRGATLDEQYRIAVAFCSSGMLPKAYTKPEQVLVGMQYAYELGLKPLMALRQICVINGQPSLWGELPLALARRTGELEFIREFWVDKDYKEINFENKNLDSEIWAAVCEIQRKGHQKRSYTFSQKDKHKLGIAAVWAQFERIMMMRKARSLALKAEFPDALEGMFIAEYDFHVMGEAGGEITVKDQKQQKVDGFKERLAKAQEGDAIPADSQTVEGAQ